MAALVTCTPEADHTLITMDDGKANALGFDMLAQLDAALDSAKHGGLTPFGEEVVREPRFIRVMSWDLLRFASPQIDFRLRCTKGTYVRTLAHDLGAKIGCGAHLAALRRTATDKFTVSQALTLDQIQAMTLPEIEQRLIPAREAVPSFVR